MKRKYILITSLLLFVVIALLYSCRFGEEPRKRDTPGEKVSGAGFVGEQACISCHESQRNEWKGSHHDYAMKRATDASVRADFSNTDFSHKGETYRFFRRDSLFMVEAPGPDGESRTYRITHTFGWAPLQQYLVDVGKGKLQALNIAWDVEQERWFALNPERDLRHGDWLHWTGGAMNWNTMCADCHSTNLQKNYIASADSFHTTWSSINVSCEACHGPGQEHANFMQTEQAAKASIRRIREDLRLTGAASQEEQINQCAQCHALREELTGTYRHQGDFLDHYSPTLPHPAAYYADGQIREEVYVYGSFLQSKMFGKGIECTDCHDPHTLELKANVTDNSLCMDCHEPRYNTPDHHFHAPNTEATQCVSCHMPGRYYMEIDFRRDHSFRIPRPDLSSKFGTPNSCNGCHESQSAEWAANAVERWYGPERPDHFSETLLRADSLGPEMIPELKKLVGDTSQPDIGRATAMWYLGEFSASPGLDFLETMLNDDSPLLRRSTARLLSQNPQGENQLVLQDALDDSVRAVRLAAAGGLARYSAADMVGGMKQPFKKALEEYRRYLDNNRYFPEGQMNRGQFFEKRGQTDKAVEAYEAALRKNPRFNPARVNLAYLYNGMGKNERASQLLQTVIDQEPSYGPAYYSLGLLRAEQNNLESAVTNFEQASGLMPRHDRLWYNWAIALQRLDRPDEAEQKYLEAIALAPDNPDYRYGLCTLYIQQEQYAKVKPHLRKLKELRPDSRQVRQLVRTLDNRMR